MSLSNEQIVDESAQCTVLHAEAHRQHHMADRMSFLPRDPHGTESCVGEQRRKRRAGVRLGQRETRLAVELRHQLDEGGNIGQRCRANLTHH